MSVTLEQIKSLPVFIDGSDGSMWVVRNDASGPCERYVRLSDLLALLARDLPKTFPDE